MSDKRRKQRQLFDCALEATWKDGGAISRTLAVHAIDLSDSGIRVESSERIELHTEVFIRAERYGLTGTTAVRHSSRRGSRSGGSLRGLLRAAANQPQCRGRDHSPRVSYHGLALSSRQQGDRG